MGLVPCLGVSSGWSMVVTDSCRLERAWLGLGKMFDFQACLDSPDENFCRWG